MVFIDEKKRSPAIGLAYEMGHAALELDGESQKVQNLIGFQQQEKLPETDFFCRHC